MSIWRGFPAPEGPGNRAADPLRYLAAGETPARAPPRAPRAAPAARAARLPASAPLHFDPGSDEELSRPPPPRARLGDGPLAAAVSDDLLELRPRYHLLREIASGGMGTIYLAEQRGAQGFRKIVALKRLRRELLEDEESTTLFVGEAKLVADLIHENIVQVYHLDQLPGGELVIVMEYYPSRNLREIGERLAAHERRLPTELAAYAVRQVCHGLAYAHRKRDVDGRRLKVVHRDVSPSNVLVGFGGGVKLVDFGIAKALPLDVPDEREVIMGKFPYMAPELARFEGTDARSDLFSLGLVFFEVLTGRMMFDVHNREELVDALARPLPSARAVDSAVPDAVDAIVARALALDPDERYQSAEAMGQAIDEYLQTLHRPPTAASLAEFVAPFFPEARRQAFW